MAGLGTLQADALVLAVIAREDSYAYQISQNIRAIADTIEPALYTILKRLKAAGLVHTYPSNSQSRVRTYYGVTLMGQTQNEVNKQQWQEYQQRICEILGKDDNDEAVF